VEKKKRFTIKWAPIKTGGPPVSKNSISGEKRGLRQTEDAVGLIVGDLCGDVKEKSSALGGENKESHSSTTLGNEYLELAPNPVTATLQSRNVIGHRINGQTIGIAPSGVERREKPNTRLKEESLSNRPISQLATVIAGEKGGKEEKKKKEELSLELPLVGKKFM